MAKPRAPRAGKTEPAISLPHKLGLALAACIAVLMVTQLSAVFNAGEDGVFTEWVTPEFYSFHIRQDLVGFPWLLWPVPVAQFLAHNWEAQPLYIVRPAGHYTRLASDMDAIEHLLRLQQAVEREPELMHPNGKVSQADCTWVHLGMLDRHDEYPSMYHAYLDGCTLVCNIVPAYWPPLADLMGQLEETTGFPYMANLYLSPRASQGFVAHTDNKDGFLLQIDGAKRWVMYNTTFRNPMRMQTVGRPWQPDASTVQGKLLFNETIKAGAMLHIPRGIVHYSEALPEAPSLHFTISSAKNLEWVQVVEELANDYAANGISSLARGQMEAFVVRSVALAKETNAAWFRASLPANYTQPNMQAVVCQNLLTVFDKLKDSLEQKFAQAIAALVAEQGNRCQSLLAIWQRNTLYPEYIHRLHANAGKRFTQHPIQILTLKSRIKPASAAIAVTVNGTHVTVSMESKIVSFRFSPQAEQVLRGIFVSGATVWFRDIKSNDFFETVSIIRVLEEAQFLSVL